MKRIPFSQILKNASVDITTEYARLYSLFYIAKYKNGMGEERTFRDYCALNFYNLPYRNTCITLDDFDTVYGFHFDLIDERLSEYDLDYL